MIQGKQAIQAFWQDPIDELGLKATRLETLELEQYVDTALKWRNIRSRAGGAVLDQGKYIVIWKQESRQRRRHRHILTALCLRRPGVCKMYR